MYDTSSWPQFWGEFRSEMGILSISFFGPKSTKRNFRVGNSTLPKWGVLYIILTTILRRIQIQNQFLNCSSVAYSMGLLMLAIILRSLVHFILKCIIQWWAFEWDSALITDILMHIYPLLSPLYKFQVQQFKSVLHGNCVYEATP